MLLAVLAGKVNDQIQQLFGAIVADAPRAGIGILLTDKVSFLSSE